jgi:Ca2+-binding RTX toxin-like protein
MVTIMMAVSILAGILVLGVLAEIFEIDGVFGSIFDFKGSSGGSDGPEDEVIQGRLIADDLTSGAGDDSIDASGGNDTVSALGGNDTVLGGNGDDLIDVGGGDDLVFGGAGEDSILGRSGNDVLYGGEGLDTLKGGTGDDTLVGYYDGTEDGIFQSGDLVDPDSLVGADGNDAFYAGSGDTVNGGAGADTIYLGTWQSATDPVTVEEYEASEDQLVIILPTTYSGPAAVTVDYLPGVTHSGTVSIDGIPLAQVQGGGTLGALTPSDVQIIYRTNFA